jgi:hypothetical protein
MRGRWTGDQSDRLLPPKEWLSELPKAQTTESPTVISKDLQREG